MLRFGMLSFDAATAAGFSCRSGQWFVQSYSANLCDFSKCHSTRILFIQAPAPLTVSPCSLLYYISFPDITVKQLPVFGAAIPEGWPG